MVLLLFWYIGLVFDFVMVCDWVKGICCKLYNFLFFGWMGSVKYWQCWEVFFLVLVGFVMLLVFLVYIIVFFDFVIFVILGWYIMIFLFYFVVGVIFFGFVMVQILMIMIWKIFKLEDYIIFEYIESMNKVILAIGIIVGVVYLIEFFIVWYFGYIYEQFVFYNCVLGLYYWFYIGMMFCNVFLLQIFWWKSLCWNVFVIFVMFIFVNIGMWFECFVIIVIILVWDYFLLSWSYYVLIWVEIIIFIGFLGLFFIFYFIFVCVVLVVVVVEVKSILKVGGDQYIGLNVNKIYYGSKEVVY